jgi:hypothetical protein
MHCSQGASGRIVTLRGCAGQWLGGRDLVLTCRAGVTQQGLRTGSTWESRSASVAVLTKPGPRAGSVSAGAA